VYQIVGYSAHKIVERLGIPAWKLSRIGIDMRRLMAEDIRQIRPFEGIGAMLRGLSDRGVALAVVTSNAYDNVRHVLGDEHAALISSYECGAPLFGKRGKLRRVLKQSGVRLILQWQLIHEPGLMRARLLTNGGLMRPTMAPGAPVVDQDGRTWGERASWSAVERRLAPDCERAAPAGEGRSAWAAESGRAHAPLAVGRGERRGAALCRAASAAPGAVGPRGGPRGPAPLRPPAAGGCGRRVGAR